MSKKLFALVICVVMIFTLSGCSLFKNPGVVDANSDFIGTNDSENEPIEVKEEKFTNPLTGVKNLSKANFDIRPVAVMVNNISIAQPVQTGLNSADIIYETEVEGGVTRLMAVFKDFSEVGQVGSVRSARYPYVDLALGHDAIYVHCGQDPTYCAPHLKDIDDLSVDTGTPGAKRIKNGLAKEHTLYIFGNELWPSIAQKFKSETNNSLWQNFAAEDETVALTGGSADRVEVPFPLLKTVFEYNKETGLYTRYSKGNEMKDYVTGQSVTVKNIFILLTTISDYPDGKHRRVNLTGGNGYYITNGGYTEIKWQKNGEKSPIKITDINGAEIKVSAGKSWVCIPNISTCKPVMQGSQPTEPATSSQANTNP